MPDSGTAGSALAEGLYWYAEKLMWGYEGVERNPDEAFKTFRQAAKLGSSDALVRIGQLQEYGRGTERDARAALQCYKAAVTAGNFYALAFLAQLLSRTSHLERAEAIWTCFFAALDSNPEPGFLAASPGELLHDYITTQLRLGLDPGRRAALRRHRLEIVGHHQKLLEHAPDARLDRLEGAARWMSLNF